MLQEPGSVVVETDISVVDGNNKRQCSMECVAMCGIKRVEFAICARLKERLVERARAGRLRFVGDGSNRTDTTYIDNAAQAQLDAFDHPERGAPAAGRPSVSSNAQPKQVGSGVNRVPPAAPAAAVAPAKPN